MMGSPPKKHSLCALFLNEDQLVKERICSSDSKFFTSRLDPILKELFLAREAKTKGMLLRAKMTENTELCSHFLNKKSNYTA